VCNVIDRLREQIHQYLDQLADEAERLRHALAALDPRASKTTARKPDARKAAEPAVAKPAPSVTTRAAARRTSQTAAPSPRRTPGATRASVLAALAGGEAMTASEVAAKVGMARPTVATTLSRLTQTGEVQKAQRGYQLSPVGGSTDAAPVTAPSEPSTPKKPRARRAPRAKPSPSATTANGQATPEPTPSPETATVVDVAATPESPAPVATAPATPQAALPTPGPAAPPSTKAAQPAGQPAPASPQRTANGATTTAVLAALTGGEAMTASEVATKAGLARPTVSTTLSRLAKSGAVHKAERGYRIGPAAGE
jgi:DNA-binding transcriptional ArsR family regulator